MRPLEAVEVQGGLLPLLGLNCSKPLLVMILVLVAHEDAVDEALEVVVLDELLKEDVLVVNVLDAEDVVPVVEDSVLFESVEDDVVVG